MTILNPITHAGVLGTNANLEPEARLQGLLRLWFGRYFSDTPFTTRRPGGTTGTLTFAACDFLWQDDKMPVNPQRPVIHTLLTPLETQKQDLTAGIEWPGRPLAVGRNDPGSRPRPYSRRDDRNGRPSDAACGITNAVADDEFRTGRTEHSRGA